MLPLCLFDRYLHVCEIKDTDQLCIISIAGQDLFCFTNSTNSFFWIPKNLKILTFCDYACRFVSDLVNDPCDMAHILKDPTSSSFNAFVILQQLFLFLDKMLGHTFTKAVISRNHDLNFKYKNDIAPASGKIIKNMK